MPRPSDRQVSSVHSQKGGVPLRVRHRDPENSKLLGWGLSALAASILVFIVAQMLPRPAQPRQRVTQAAPVKQVPQDAAVALGELTGVGRPGEGAQSAIVLRSDGRRETARTGARIMIGDRLETRGATVRFHYAAESTHLEFAADSIATFRDSHGGKRIHLDRSTLEADVAKQPYGQPLVLTTPHAVATVIGTRFWLSVTTDLSRLDVNEGLVRFVRKADGASRDVATGQWASSAVTATALDWKPQLAVHMSGPKYSLIRPITEGCCLSRKYLAKAEGGRLDIILRELPRDATSVLFAYDGVWRTTVETVSPYHLTDWAGVARGQATSWEPEPGPHAVSVIPCGADGQKLGPAVTVRFTITE